MSDGWPWGVLVAIFSIPILLVCTDGFLRMVKIYGFWPTILVFFMFQLVMYDYIQAAKPKQPSMVVH